MVTQELVKEFLDYNFDTGEFYWKYRDKRWFKTQRDCNAWNTRFFGNIAGVLDGGGYIAIRIFGCRYMAHRLLFLWMYGHYPVNEIDHIDHNRANNLLINLREVSHAENHKNVSLQRNNSSGVVGVSWNKNRSKWKAYGKLLGKMYDLGFFINKDDAARAAVDFRIANAFHSNHGLLNEPVRYLSAGV